ncbi:SDR family oxidoreductase [Fontivita pretiosa]|uniref:SDR family oxidoreductase n=1 Tax=Fontivita pretiosa TaxID=2989684 RepID=UPI003D17F914
MKILILGGTGFLGPHFVELATAHQHTVTLFNRGRTNPHLFPHHEKLQGDRDPNRNGGIKALEGRKWDAVVDTSGYVPRHVKASAELLAPNVRQYVFVSTVSVYADMSRIGIDETAPVAQLDDPTIEKVTGETYGPLKAACERVAEQAMHGRVTIIRPGLIVGPGDPTDRFTYWPVRIDRGGEVLAPGDPMAPVQFIDVRDLAEFILRTIEDGHVGIYNALGPLHPFPMIAMLYGCKAVSTSDAFFTWVSQEFLLANGVSPWTEIPLWVPDDPEHAGFSRVSNARAVSIGLYCRPFADTARDTLNWARTLPENHKWGAGLDPEKEKRLLAAWKQQQSSPATAPATR